MPLRGEAAVAPAGSACPGAGGVSGGSAPPGLRSDNVSGTANPSGTEGRRQALPEADERVSGRGAWLWSLLHLSLALSPGAHFSTVASFTVSATVDDCCGANVMSKQRPGPCGPSVPGRVLSGSRTLTTNSTAHLP